VAAAVLGLLADKGIMAGFLTDANDVLDMGIDEPD
jgi:hypothetical protein